MLRHCITCNYCYISVHDAAWLWSRSCAGQVLTLIHFADHVNYNAAREEAARCTPCVISCSAAPTEKNSRIEQIELARSNALDCAK